MTQETGETRNAIIEDDERLLQDILDANKAKRNPYWIVLFAKPSKSCVEGKPTLVKHIKAYAAKPPSQVGMVIGAVDNKTGSISWEVNMPQRPFDFDGLLAMGGESSNELVTETTSIPMAYVTK